MQNDIINKEFNNTIGDRFRSVFNTLQGKTPEMTDAERLMNEIQGTQNTKLFSRENLLPLFQSAMEKLRNRQQLTKDEQDAVNQMNNQTPEKNNTALYIGLGVLGLAVLGVGAYLIFKN